MEGSKEIVRRKTHSLLSSTEARISLIIILLLFLKSHKENVPLFPHLPVYIYIHTHTMTQCSLNSEGILQEKLLF